MGERTKAQSWSIYVCPECGHASFESDDWEAGCFCQMNPLTPVTVVALDDVVEAVRTSAAANAGPLADFIAERFGE